jgi:Putative periplasmic protein kinase ArgK and related GTPases of G3E family
VVSTEVLLSALKTPRKIVTITSCVLDEGKSTFAINFAFSQAKTKRVLLIEGDMRRPCFDKAMILAAGQKGLSELLSGAGTLEECLLQVDGMDLHVIAAGHIPPNPQELLVSRKFSDMLTTLRDRYDMIIIETVGVGQDEVDVVRAAHTIVVVSAPGLGDDIQAIKAGILEIADVHAVSKGDRPDSDRTVSELKSMLGLGLVATGIRRAVPVIKTCSPKDEGVAELLAAIDAHRQNLLMSGEYEERRQSIRERRMLKAAEQILHDEFERHRQGRMADLLAELAKASISPHTAALRLLAHIGMEVTR